MHRNNLTVLFYMHVSSLFDYGHPKASGYPTSHELLLLVSSSHIDAASLIFLVVFWHLMKSAQTLVVLYS
jgi:hypothetical protein